MFSVNSSDPTHSRNLPTISPLPADVAPLASLQTQLASAGNLVCLSGGHGLKRAAEPLPPFVPVKRHNMGRSQSAPAGIAAMPPLAEVMAEKMECILHGFNQDADVVQRQLYDLKHKIIINETDDYQMRLNRSFIHVDRLIKDLNDYLDCIRELANFIYDGGIISQLKLNLHKLEPFINRLIEEINELVIMLSSQAQL